MIKNVRKMGRVLHLSESNLQTSAQHTEIGAKIKELSGNTVAFISCRSRLTKVLADAARGETGSKDGGGREHIPTSFNPALTLVSPPLNNLTLKISLNASTPAARSALTTYISYQHLLPDDNRKLNKKQIEGKFQQIFYFHS